MPPPTARTADPPVNWTLHTKLRIIATPVILVSAIAPAVLITNNTQTIVLENTTQSLFHEVENHKDRIQHYYELLRKAQLEKIPSYVEKYQQTAFADATYRAPDLRSEMFVVAESGRLLFASAEPDPAWESEIGRIHATIPDEHAGTRCEVPDSGSDRQLIYCASRFEPWNLSIIHAIGRSQLFAEFERLWLYSAALIAAIMIVSFVGLFYFIDRFIIRRILGLTTAIDAIDSSNLSTGIIDFGSDELGSIGARFNAMLLRLRATIASKEVLDQEVKQRRRAESELESKIESLESTERRLLATRSEQAILIERLQTMQRQMVTQEKLAGIGLLAAGVAHEINSPIAFVNTNLNTLVDYFEDLLAAIDDCPCRSMTDPKGIATAQAIDCIRADLPALFRETQDGIMRVRRIVNGLRAYGRHDTGQKQPIDLHQCLDTAITLVRNEIKYHAVVETDYVSTPKVLADEQQLTQVFVNLLLNATQAIDRNGAIEIRSRRADGKVVVEIQDNGSGMTEEVQNRLFEPFFTTKAIGQGTGLGLSIVHGIVTDHGGSIDIRSQIGTGTTVAIVLPPAPQIGKTTPAIESAIT